MQGRRNSVLIHCDLVLGDRDQGVVFHAPGRNNFVKYPRNLGTRPRYRLICQGN
jgi:hypothetical protein